MDPYRTSRPLPIPGLDTEEPEFSPDEEDIPSDDRGKGHAHEESGGHTETGTPRGPGKN